MKKNILILVIPLLLSSCESWLDVKPNDRISEEATFSTPRGFELALNGVYVDLNKTSLYAGPDMGFYRNSCSTLCYQ